MQKHTECRGSVVRGYRTLQGGIRKSIFEAWWSLEEMNHEGMGMVLNIESSRITSHEMDIRRIKSAMMVWNDGI